MCIPTGVNLVVFLPVLLLLLTSLMSAGHCRWCYKSVGVVGVALLLLEIMVPMLLVLVVVVVIVVVVLMPDALAPVESEHVEPHALLLVVRIWAAEDAVVPRLALGLEASTRRNADERRTASSLLSVGRFLSLVSIA